MYNRNSNILEKTNVTAAQLHAAMVDIRPDYGLRPALDAIVQAEKRHGISAIFIAAHAATETGWGKSIICVTKNNLFGFNAVDSNPGHANKYPSQAASVEHYAAFLKEHYLTSGGKYYNGTTPSGIMTRYASAGDRAADTIAEVMSMIATRIGVTPAPIPDGFPEKPAKVEQEIEPEPEPEQPDEEPKQEDERSDADEQPAPEPKKKSHSKSKR